MPDNPTYVDNEGETEMNTTLYKVLGPKGESTHGGKGTWALPNGKAGKWMPPITNPRCCQRGYHLVELWSLAEWLLGDCTIYVAEGKGAKHTDGSGKTAFAQARLVRQVHISERDLRLFAADCAEHVLPIFLKVRPDDDRPAKAIEVARARARGESTAAAWYAAGDAAGAASWDAARATPRDAARAAAWYAAWYAAWAAAGAASGAASWAAGGDAAGAASWAAAGDAAGDAARDAAADAAWAAAGDAAGDAARAAERVWQADRLAFYLNLEEPEKEKVT